MTTERRLLVREVGPAGSIVELDENARHHLRVLRLSVGDAITIFDGKGARANATVLSTDEPTRLRVDAIARANVARVPIVLVQCLPKGGKLDDIVRAATELGVSSIRLASSDHAVSKLDDRWDRKHARLVRIAEEAARQSERDDVPSILAPEPVLVHASAAPEGAIRLSLCGRSGRRPAVRDAHDIWLVVGPEGGLAERELSGLDALSYVRTSIAPTILRVETAAVAALAIARVLAEGDGDR